MRLGDPVRGAGRARSTRRGAGWTAPAWGRTEEDHGQGQESARAAPGDVATNRQASYRYNLLERFECGIVLTGTEVKSLREGKAQLKDAYAAVRDGEVWLIGVYIPPYGPASRENHDPERPRKLLLHRSEIERLIGRTQERGLTLVPTRIYFSGPARAPRSRSRWRAARTSTTSARRSASARWRATSSASCAKSTAERRATAAARVGVRGPGSHPDRVQVTTCAAEWAISAVAG